MVNNYALIEKHVLKLPTCLHGRYGFLKFIFSFKPFLLAISCGVMRHSVTSEIEVFPRYFDTSCRVSQNAISLLVSVSLLPLN